MTKILHINASPRGPKSQSALLADAYLRARALREPAVQVDSLNLWSEDLPEFDGDKNAAKLSFFGVGEMDAAGKSAWDQVVEVTQRFIEADEYVFNVPMWNGGIPYKLKHYIDVITQPGLLFGFEPERGYFGLLENKTAHVFYSSGVYAPGADKKYGEDFHSAYMDWWFGLVGIETVVTTRHQPSILTMTPDADLETAIARAKAAA
ncbi:NAD(P)H-dependent oxidoreductase [uncultured Roseibium sp.]|uniref:FMN-dependent NADH-azoreductase n=1 Tax=uncultured Roseibium sp. TaxID=1936171 RepID=UPI002621ECCB|nr:NAD(P)H-dependent oxidoreductase [uncultured Roseibium sp.]